MELRDTIDSIVKKMETARRNKFLKDSHCKRKRSGIGSTEKWGTKWGFYLW